MKPTPPHGNGTKRPHASRRWFSISLALAFAYVQAREDPAIAQTPPLSPRDAAPMDLTGDWTSVVTEDWRWRMMVAPRGDFASVPLNDAGRELADRWDPDRDRSDGDACKAYGAGGIMRLPARVRIAWANDHQLRLAIDAGDQTRVLDFSAETVPGAASRQGRSSARWRGDVTTRTGVTRETEPRYLEVTTTGLKPGYLRRNGVPYSENARVIEYYYLQGAYGRQWMTVVTIVEDPTYLTQPFVTSSTFRKLDGKARWEPTSCESDWGPIPSVGR